MTELVLLGFAVLLILACGLFVAAEFSLIAVNRSTVERLAAKGDMRAKGVLKALTTLSTQLSSAQAGITITTLVIGYLSEPAIAHILEGPLTDTGLPETAVPGIAIAIGIGLATVITMIFGELVPKSLAIAKPLGTAKFIERPLLIFTTLMKYPIQLLNGSANLILARFGIEPQEELASARSADELVSLVRRSAEKGTLAKETALMLERSLTFSDLTALDVMTPRVRVKSLQADAPVTAILELARNTGLSRFPVFEKNLDSMVGVAHVKHAISMPPEDREHARIRQIMRPPVLVPSTIELEPLLEALRKGGLQMAIVIDEFGGTDGIVTMEDVLEELVGEVHDEHDRSRGVIHKRKDGTWLLAGLLRPDEIGEEIGIFLPEEEEVETLAGLLMHHLEHIPEVGNVAELPAVNRDGDELKVRLKVERMEGNRVDRIQMAVLDAGKNKDGANA